MEKKIVFSFSRALSDRKKVSHSKPALSGIVVR